MSTALRYEYDIMYQLETGDIEMECSPEEDITVDSLYSYWLEEYKRCKILTIFGLSIDMYLDRPRYEIVMLNKSAEAQLKEDLEVPKL